MAEIDRKKKKELNAEDYIEGILNSDITVLSQAITLIESTHPKHAKIAREIVDGCLKKAGNSVRIGVTGVPGVGKSSFIETFGLHVIEKHNRKVAVLAIDPTSTYSKGSILGDKVRMERLSKHPQAFIRPSPSSGSLGGVARKTREVIYLCEAAGFDTIMIETVGVGQSEISVHTMVDFFLLLLLAGAGDSLQGIKRGIIEMADALAITKADGDNLPKAEKAKKEYQSAIKLFPPSESGWVPKVLVCSAVTGLGIPELWETIEEYCRLTKDNGYFYENRKKQAIYWMHETIKDRLERGFYEHPEVKKILNEVEDKVTKGQMSPFSAAEKLLEVYLGDGGGY